MAPSTAVEHSVVGEKSVAAGNPNENAQVPSAVVHRSLNHNLPQMVSASGKILTLSGGHTILDTSCGAGVTCLGYNNKRVRDAMIAQIDKFSYCNSMFFGHSAEEELAAELIQGTGGAMSKAYFMCSGEKSASQSNRSPTIILS